jgi:hypothetical protein
MTSINQNDEVQQVALPTSETPDFDPQTGISDIFLQAHVGIWVAQAV